MRCAGVPCWCNTKAEVTWRKVYAGDLQSDLFTQRKRLVEADRKLQTKITKTALESRRIASNNIERAQAKMAELRRTVQEDAGVHRVVAGKGRRNGSWGDANVARGKRYPSINACRHAAAR